MKQILLQLIILFTILLSDEFWVNPTLLNFNKRVQILHQLMPPVKILFGMSKLRQYKFSHH